MNTAIVITILSVLALVLAAAIVAVFTSKQRTESKLRAELAESNARLMEATKLEGRVQESTRNLEAMQVQLDKRDRTIKECQDEIVGLSSELSKAQERANSEKVRADEMVKQERESLAKVIAAKDEQIEALNDFITKARETLGTEFKALSADALKDVSGQMQKAAEAIIEKHSDTTVQNVKLHKQQIETMLKPVEETIKRLDKHVEDTNVERSKAEGLLEDQINRLAGASESLTNALKKPVIRGSWGEMTLENALENAGLEAEIDFVLQHTTDHEDGRQRTDAVINLPKGRKLIIDSKNMMESYIAYSSATDEAEKALLADAHSKNFRGHVKALSGKEYWKRYEGLDCVILFIPHDGMYHAALQNEEEIIRDANNKRVFVANPMTLIPLLKSIRYVLDQERLNKSAAEISKIGIELYGKMGDYTTKVANLGRNLRLTVKAFNATISPLDRFIVSKARSLKSLGAGKGIEPSLPESIEIEPKAFSSQELRSHNSTVNADQAWFDDESDSEDEGQDEAALVTQGNSQVSQEPTP